MDKRTLAEFGHGSQRESKGLETHANGHPGGGRGAERTRWSVSAGGVHVVEERRHGLNPPGQIICVRRGNQEGPGEDLEGATSERRTVVGNETQ